MQLWFYAMHLFTTTRHGVSGKELQRQLGVTYKTAWRMAKHIREHMAECDGEAQIGGPGTAVEVDETLVGGVQRGTRMRGSAGKVVIAGALQRGGDIIVKVVSNQRRVDATALRHCQREARWRTAYRRIEQLSRPSPCRVSAQNRKSRRA